MGDIKSSFEKAMERIEGIGEASEEELMKWKYTPIGQKLVADYIKENCNLVAEIEKYEDNAKFVVIRGVEDVLVNNINLPVNELSRKNNERAMEGIKVLKTDKAGIENVYTKIKRIFSHYEQEGEQQRKQAYESLKQDFQYKIQQIMKQQGGIPPGGKIDVEQHPQFQEEWRRVSAQLDSQYHKLLGEYKREIVNLR